MNAAVEEYTSEKQAEIIRDGKLFYNYRHFLPKGAHAGIIKDGRSVHFSSGDTTYIGKGRKSRINAGRGADYGIFLSCLKDSGIEIDSEIFFASTCESTVFENESLAIKAIGRAEFGGTLFNRTDGGEGMPGWLVSEEFRRKIGEASKGRTHSEETRLKMSEANKGERNPNFGRTFSEEYRRKLSEAKKGRCLSEEHRRKIGEAGKGRTHSEESRRKISKANKGKRSFNFGKTLSEETKIKISESRKGELNPNFGKTLNEEHRRKLSEAQQLRWLKKSFPAFSYADRATWPVNQWRP